MTKRKVCVAVASPEDYDVFNPVFKGMNLVVRSEWHYVNAFSDALDQAGIRLVTYAFSKTGKAGLYHSPDDGRWTRLLKPSALTLRLSQAGTVGRWLGGLLNSFKLIQPLVLDQPDLVMSLHFPLFPRNQVLFAVTRFLGTKFGCFQAYPLPDSPSLRKVGKIASMADFYVITEPHAAIAATRTYGIPQKRLHFAGLVPDRTVLKYLLEEGGKPHERTEDILFVGRLDDRQKRISVLIRAFSDVVKAFPSSKLKIVGEGGDRGKLGALASKLELGNRVEFLGWVNGEELARRYLMSRAFCLPSVEESYAIVVTEAMLASLPVVASDLPALKDRLIDGVTGYAVPPDDIKRFAAKISELLADPELSERMGREARKLSLRITELNMSRLVTALRKEIE